MRREFEPGAFLQFLKALYRKFPGKHLHVIVDNLAVHKHQKVMAWLESKRRMTLRFTPTYFSWLNQAEIWFNIFARNVLKDRVWRSNQQLVGQIMEYIKNCNQLWAKPFKWTCTGTPWLPKYTPISRTRHQLPPAAALLGGALPCSSKS